VPVDILQGKHFDVTDARVEREISQWIREGLVWCVVMGTPCTPWSRARATGSAASPSHHAALACAHMSRRLLRLCRLHGVHVVVENPRSSGLWTWRPFARELSLLKAAFVDLHMCAYDAAWLKPTRLAGTLPGLSRMARRCPGGVKHVVLQGLVTAPDGKQRWRTSFAAAYPAAFSKHLAALLAESAPPASRRPPAEPRLLEWWERRLAKVTATETPSKLVAIANPSSRPRLGWEGSRKFWCGECVSKELEILKRHCRANRRARRSLAREAETQSSARATTRRRGPPEAA